MSQLGGWWRLWLILSIPIFVIVIVIAWPSDSDEERERIKKSIDTATQDLSILSAKNGEMWEPEGPKRQKIKIYFPNRYKENDVASFLDRQAKDGNLASVNQVKEEIFSLENWLSSNEKQRQSDMVTAIGKAIIIPLLLLTIGLASKWVLAGFARTKMGE